MSSNVLVPISLPDPESVPASLVELLSSTSVFVLGVYDVPDQTALELARDTDQGESEKRINTVADQFSEVGAEVTSKIVFTHDRRETIDRVATEEDCNVILVPNHAGRMEWVLVPLRGDANLERVTDFVDDLTTDVLQKVSLVHVAESETDREEGKALIENGRQKLVEAGIDDRLIDTDLVVSDDVVGTVTERAKDYDTIVMGGTEPSLLDRIFGDIPHRISQETGCPVFVIPPET